MPREEFIGHLAYQKIIDKIADEQMLKARAAAGTERAKRIPRGRR